MNKILAAAVVQEKCKTDMTAQSRQ